MHNCTSETVLCVCLVYLATAFILLLVRAYAQHLLYKVWALQRHILTFYKFVCPLHNLLYCNPMYVVLCSCIHNF
jgi:hypothetical protein